MILRIFMILYFCVLSQASNLFSSETPEDAKLNFTSLGVKYGHSVEEHKVVTDDGYILTLFRIPGRRKPPVLLMHGTGDLADTFIVRGKKSLAITLADASYDVWVGNLRGNKYARRHIKLNPDTDQEFWNFSFHEAGYYDLPATIDCVLNATGEEKLQTIGHSQGSTAHFVLLSTKPEYNEKIKLFIALAPVAFLNNLTPPVSIISDVGPAIDRFAREIGMEEVPGDKLPLPNFNSLNCGQVESENLLHCTVLTLFYAIGFDSRTIEPEFFQVLIGRYPGTTSRKTLTHYNQVVLRKKFANYDYGTNRNKKRYGSTFPPEYNLQQVKIKTAMLVGRSDGLATVKDAEILKALLPNVVRYHIMKPKSWNHVDFTWRVDMDVYMFPVVLELLEKHR